MYGKRDPQPRKIYNLNIKDKEQEIRNITIFSCIQPPKVAGEIMRKGLPMDLGIWQPGGGRGAGGGERRQNGCSVNDMALGAKFLDP